MKLAAMPTVRLDVDADESVAIFVAETGHNYFCGFNPRSLRVFWTQRAPGTVDDPHGHHDYMMRTDPYGHQHDTGMLWRARCSKDFRDLIDRRTVEGLAVLVEETD